MKRIISFFLLIILLPACCACSRKANETANYYYKIAEFKLGKDQTVIVPEIRNVTGYSDDYERLIHAYLKGPIDEEHVSPFPKGTSLVSFTIGSTRAHIVLSAHLSTLSGHELTIACACIGKTVLEMTDARSVEIKAEDSLLNGQQSFIISENDLFLQDNYTEIQEDNTN